MKKQILHAVLIFLAAVAVRAQEPAVTNTSAVVLFHGQKTQGQLKSPMIPVPNSTPRLEQHWMHFTLLLKNS